jgi:hypothetical protein
MSKGEYDGEYDVSYLLFKNISGKCQMKFLWKQRISVVNSDGLVIEFFVGGYEK